MRRLTAVIMLVSCFFFACDKTSTKIERPEFVISEDEAYDLLNEWIYNEYNPEMASGIYFEVEEKINKDVNNKMEAQVFIVKCTIPGLSNRAVFIKDKKVFDLGRYNLYGANEIEYITVTDLNSDGNYELCFCFTHGSGILRTSMACYMNEPDNVLLCSNVNFLMPLDYSIKISGIGDGNLNVIYVKEGSETLIGTANLNEIDSKYVFNILINSNLPQEIINDIW